MPPNVRTLRYTQRALNFSGGLNSQIPPTEIADNELVSCNNFWYPSGILSKRPGFFKVCTFVTGASTTQPKVVVGFDPIRKEYLVGQYQTGSLWAVSIYSGAAPTFVAVSGPASRPFWSLFINGTVYVGYYAGASSGIRTYIAGVISGAYIANSPSSKVAAWHKSRIFADVTATAGRIAFSDPNAPATWQAASTIDIGVDDREQITALISIGDLLLIFKNTSVWSLFVQGSSPADWVVRKISNSVGCVNSDIGTPAIAYNGYAYFISRLGLFRTNGSSFENLSNNVWVPENPAYDNLVGGVHTLTRFGEHLILAGTNTTLDAAGVSASPYNYIYNLNTKAWSTWSFLGGLFDSVYATFPYDQGGTGDLIRTQLLGFQGNSAYFTDFNAVYNYDALLATGVNSYSDGFQWPTAGTGAAFTSQFTSKEFSSFNDWYWRNRWNSLEYTARTPGPTFNMIGDGSARASQTPGFHATLRKGYKITGAGRCRLFQLSCSHALTSPFEFYRGETHFTLKTHISASGTP